MSAAQAGILLLSLLWPSFFIKSVCLPLGRLPRPFVPANVVCGAFDEARQSLLAQPACLLAYCQLILLVQPEPNEQNPPQHTLLSLHTLHQSEQQHRQMQPD